MENVTDRVRRSGGQAHVFAFCSDKTGDGGRLIVFRLSGSTGPVSDGAGIAIKQQTTVGQLLDLLVPGAPFTLRLADESIVVDDIMESSAPSELSAV